MQNRNIVKTGFAILLAVALLGVARATPTNSQLSKLKAMFQKKYGARDKAWLHKDLDTYLSYFADDYTNYDEQGNVRYSSKQEYRDILAAYMASHKSVPLPHEAIKDVKPTSDGMVVTLAGLNGHHHRDFWVNSQGTWLIKQYRRLD